MAVGEQAGANALPPIPGILVTGDSLPLPSEQYEMLERMLGGLGLTPTIIEDVEGIASATERSEVTEPIPAGRMDFIAFARENGFTDRMGHNAWNTISFTGARQQFGDYPSAVAPLRFIDDPSHDVVDLHSVRARLDSSAFTTGVWSKGSARRIGFLRALIDARIGSQSDRNTSGD